MDIIKAKKMESKNIKINSRNKLKLNKKYIQIIQPTRLRHNIVTFKK